MLQQLATFFGLTGIVDTVRNFREVEGLNLNDPKTWKDVIGSVASQSGTSVDHDSAFTYDPFWQAV